MQINDKEEGDVIALIKGGNEDASETEDQSNVGERFEDQLIGVFLFIFCIFCNFFSCQNLSVKKAVLMLVKKMGQSAWNFLRNGDTFAVWLFI